MPISVGIGLGLRNKIGNDDRVPSESLPPGRLLPLMYWIAI